MLCHIYVAQQPNYARMSTVTTMTSKLHNTSQVQGNDAISAISISSLVYSTSSSTSSSSTEWGPGTLMGKALSSFGEVMKDGIEHILIRRRVNKISAVLSYKRVMSKKQMDQVYDDLLELSRPGLYRSQIRQQALKCILTQIGSGQTGQLISSLEKWPLIELRIFLSEVMSCLPAEWSLRTPNRKDSQNGLANVYLSASIESGTHAAQPIINFLLLLASIDPRNCREILDTGFLDILLNIYAFDFSFSTITWRWQYKQSRDNVLGLSHSLLQTASQQSECVSLIAPHPVISLWPNVHSIHNSLSVPVADAWYKRRIAWRNMDVSIAKERIRAVPAFIAKDPVHQWDSTDLANLFVDLLEISSWRGASHNDIPSFAQSELLELFTIGSSRRKVFNTVLFHSSYEDNHAAFCQIIRYIMPYRPTLYAQKFSEDNFTQKFLMYALTTNHTLHVRRSLLDAGILFFLLTVIRDVGYPYAPEIVLNLNVGAIVPLSWVNAAASALVGYVRQQSTGPSENIPKKWKHNWRRGVEIFLGDGDIVGDSYQECEALFGILLT